MVVKRMTPDRTKAKAKPDFVLKAQRAFRRVARKLRAENKRTGIPLAVWPTEKPKSKRTTV
jgi:hypothetical protein